MDTLRVALIGYGTGGAVFHAPLVAAAPDLELAAVVTSNPERQASVRSRYPGAEILEISHELLRKAFLWREARVHVGRRATLVMVSNIIEQSAFPAAF